MFFKSAKTISIQEIMEDNGALRRNPKGLVEGMRGELVAFRVRPC